MRYRNKRKYIDAIQWTGENKEECLEFLGINFFEFRDNETRIVFDSNYDDWIASIGDYIIKDGEDDFYVYKAENFEREYVKDTPLDEDHFMNTILSVPKSAVEMRIECKYYDREIKTMYAELDADAIQENRRMYLELDPTDDHFGFWVLNE